MRNHPPKKGLRDVGQSGERNRGQPDDVATSHKQQTSRPAFGNPGLQPQMGNLATINHLTCGAEFGPSAWSLRSLDFDAPLMRYP